MIVGAQGVPGGGVALHFFAERLTDAAAPAQAKNWLFPWGFSLYPATAITDGGVRLYPPLSGNIRSLRALRNATAGDITFDVEVNGTAQLSLSLPGGAGAAVASDLVSTYAMSLGDYLTVAITAATPDSTTNTMFVQLSFLID